MLRKKQETLVAEKAALQLVARFFITIALYI